MIPDVSGNTEMRDLSERKFRDDSVKEIVREFDVPIRTAQEWERKIGDVDAIREAFEGNVSTDYFDLIRRREAIPRELENVEIRWIEPLRRWCTDRAEGVHLVDRSEDETIDPSEHYYGTQSFGLGSGWRAVALKTETLEETPEKSGINWEPEMKKLREGLEEKEECVIYEMRGRDHEWIGLVRELWQVNKSLVTVYREHLQESSHDLPNKKDKIMELKRSFPYLRMNDDLVVRATKSSIYYVRQFKQTDSGEFANEKPPKHLKQKVRERDENRCVRCGSEDELHVHHVIPWSKGGEHKPENLATLCGECHRLAHGGKFFDDENEFWGMDYGEVVYDGLDDFWHKWVDEIVEP